MKYIYRNKNTGGEVELPKPRATFDESPDWELVEGSAPEASASGEQPAQTVIDPAGLDDAQLIDLFLAAAAALREREDTIDEDLFEARREQVEAIFGSLAEDSTEPEEQAEPAESKSGSEAEVAGQTEIQATAFAVKLAEEKGIDLRTLTGTGDDGRITVGDVRAADEATA